MSTRSAVCASLGIVMTLLAIGSSTALDKVSEGVFRVNVDRVDDLLRLENMPDAKVLILEDKDPKSLSDAHVKVTRTWVEAGGVLWVAGDGLDSAIARGVAPFRMERFDYKRSATGDRGGELVVKGVSPRLVIHDHPLTAGVTQLYLFARYKFDGTSNAQPLVEITDTQGNHGLILVAIPQGRGLMVLDGTARKGQLFFGRLPGFDPKRPNSLKQDKGWNNYDWDKLMANAVTYARLPS